MRVAQDFVAIDEVLVKIGQSADQSTERLPRDKDDGLSSTEKAVQGGTTDLDFIQLSRVLRNKTAQVHGRDEHAMEED